MAIKQSIGVQIMYSYIETIQKDIAAMEIVKKSYEEQLENFDFKATAYLTESDKKRIHLLLSLQIAEERGKILYANKILNDLRGIKNEAGKDRQSEV